MSKGSEKYSGYVEYSECLHLRVFGQVQGVNFRYFTVMKARSLGVTGFVSNEEDGSVRIVACAGKEALEKFLQEIQNAPAPIKIERVEKKFEKCAEQFESFEVKF